MGHKVTIITPTLGPEETNSDIVRLSNSNKLQYKTVYFLKNLNLHGFFNAFIYNEFYFRLSEYLKNKDIDLIISTNIWSNLVEKKNY